MCGRYSEVTVAEKLEKNFRAKFSQLDLFKPNPNISVGDYAPVITNDKPNEIQMFQFGLTPHWASKRTYFFNARAEGDHNKENDPNYRGAKGIITKPAFMNSIRSKRCLVLADGFIEGPEGEGLSRPFIIYLKERKPFAMAGIWSEWTDKETGEIVKSFAIITTTANELLQEIRHHRSPVILNTNDYQKWLRETNLASITSLLYPYPAELLSAHPISPSIKDPKEKNIDVLKPIGNVINFERKISISIPLPKNHRKGKINEDANDTLENRMKPR